MQETQTFPLLEVRVNLHEEKERTDPDHSMNPPLILAGWGVQEAGQKCDRCFPPTRLFKIMDAIEKREKEVDH